MTAPLARRVLAGILASAVALPGAAEPAVPEAAAEPAVPEAGSPGPGAPGEAPPRPDIVVIYMDDFSPRAADLWRDPSRTPALARYVAEGIELNASASTPLCCPARANLLTGTYGHRNGVTRIDMRGFEPEDTLAVALQAAGYHTAYVGKFLNTLSRWAPDRRSVRRYALGWDAFDVIWEYQGRFHDYRLWTQGGVQRRGRAARDHSSRVAGLRAARHIRAAPEHQPLFLIVSLYDGHPPFTPMARFRRHPACRQVAPWAGPSYDERDVSDKPGFVRSRPRLGGRGYPLRQRCEAVLTVDWVAQRVHAALEAAGRADDALVVFSADNGMLMGEHRLTSKGYPYSTPVPMFAWWPARWGRAGRAIREPVQNVDLAPTFCRLAGCDLGDVDGLDLTPLLDGAVDRLERRFVYEELLHPGPRWPARGAMPAWYGIRTTLAWSDRLWVYTEYANGETELYDLTDDPHQLTNLAGDAALAGVEAELRDMLHAGVVGPRGVRFRATPAS